MSEERKKLPTHTTSKGIAKFCYLNTPNETFKVEGEYSVDFVQSPTEAKPLIALIDAAMAASLEEAKKDNPKLKKIQVADPPYKNDTDKEGNETGLIKFKFKAKASGTKKDKTTWTFRPRIFDAKGAVIPSTVSIWGGSVVRVCFQIAPFYTAKVGAGVSLRLQAVKVLELKSGQGKDAASYGFGEEEEGYSGEEAGSSAGAGEGAEDVNQDF